MPRQIPDTPWTTRFKSAFLLQQNQGKILQENGGGLLLERSIASQWENRDKPETSWN